MDEEAVKIGLVNHPDLYQFIGNKALSDPRFYLDFILILSWFYPDFILIYPILIW